jgi:2-polyprenyl-6-methoxyphenol hydroxylase-like FAD-dependent oxidoreductase
VTKVIIVGAGPAGATLAYLLVQRGIAVTLVEASRTFERFFRGEGLMPNGLDALAQMGLAPLLQHLPHRSLAAWEFWLDQHRLFRVDEPLEKGGKSTTLVSQPEFLEAVVATAARYSGFEFVHGVTVQNLLWQNDRVSGVLLADGRSLSADLVVGTDGRQSTVRQRANLTLTQQPQRFDILWFSLVSHPQFARENIFYSILKGDQALGLFQSAQGRLQVGWFLSESSPSDGQNQDWSSRLTATVPPWLTEHVREHGNTLTRPVLLSVRVGICPRWWVPGALLLGDAAHPMSPIRAQGINMALRDAVVATNHLVPALSSSKDHAALDAALPQIQTERLPEIMRAQVLQQQEVNQAQLLGSSAPLRWAVTQGTPVLRPLIRQAWLRRQRLLRQGVTPVILRV